MNVNTTHSFHTFPSPTMQGAHGRSLPMSHVPTANQAEKAMLAAGPDTLAWPTLGQNNAVRMSFPKDIVKESTLSSAMNNQYGKARPAYPMDFSASAPSPQMQQGVPRDGRLPNNGSYNSQLDASAPIWTPSPKQKSLGEEHGFNWTRQAHSPISPISPNGFSGGSNGAVETRSSRGYRQRSSSSGHGNMANGVGSRRNSYQKNMNGQQQQQQQNWQPGSWSGSVSPMSYGSMNGSPMMQGVPVVIAKQQGSMMPPPGSSPLGSSPSSPGTGVFLPSSSASSRRPSAQSSMGMSPPSAGMGKQRFSPTHGINSNSPSSHHTAISLPDELF